MNKKIVGMVLCGLITVSTYVSGYANESKSVESGKTAVIQEIEPNDKMAEAQSIPFNTNINGSASYGNDDYFKFRLPVDSTLYFDGTSYTSSSVYIYFDIYDEYGKKIYTNWSLNNDTRKYNKELTAGVYYLKVRTGWDGNNKYYFNLSRNYFRDTQKHWAENQINNFVDKGYINGYHDNTFKPDNSITRAEFVRILNNTFGLTKLSGKVFNDTTNHWARKDIDIAVTNGVCNGKSTTEFKPDDSITREEAALMIANYKKIKDTNHDKLNIFYDNKEVSSWAKDGVEGAIENGYMNGYSENNTFRPKNNITRAEAVSTLSRAK